MAYTGSFVTTFRSCWPGSPVWVCLSLTNIWLIFINLSQVKRLVARVYITDDEEIWEVLKVRKDKTGVDDLPYEVRLETVAHVCPLPGNSLQPLNGTGDYSPDISPGVWWRFCIWTNIGDRIDNFWPLTMLNAELKTLTKVLTNYLQVVLDRLIFPEQICSVKSWMIQDNFICFTWS